METVRPITTLLDAALATVQATDDTPVAFRLGGPLFVRLLSELDDVERRLSQPGGPAVYRSYPVYVDHGAPYRLQVLVSAREMTVESPVVSQIGPPYPASQVLL